MYKEKTILAVVPARGGSKGIPLKNLISINGKSLIQLVSTVIHDVGIFDDAVISTDHQQIAEEAQSYGLSFYAYRNSTLSGDLVPDQPVLIDALHVAEANTRMTFDIIVMLQPTSPLRKSVDVISVIDKLISSDAHACWSLSLTDTKQHPLKQLIISGEYISYYDNLGMNIIGRQQLKPTFHRNGVAYAIYRDALFASPSLLPVPTIYHLVSTPQVSIDTPEDIRYAEYLALSGF